MTANAKLFTPEELEEFVSLLEEWPNSQYGDDASMLSVSPFLTFYLSYDPERHLDASLTMIDTLEAFEALSGSPFTIATHPDSERPHPCRWAALRHPPSYLGFFLSDNWRTRLGCTRDELRGHLRHADTHMSDCDSGIWIELGSKPDLYPVRSGEPELLPVLNRVLKPIRHQRLDLTGLGQWDGDPNERFTLTDTQRWLGRFDEARDWPCADARLPCQ